MNAAAVCLKTPRAPRTRGRENRSPVPPPMVLSLPNRQSFRASECTEVAMLNIRILDSATAQQCRVEVYLQCVRAIGPKVTSDVDCVGNEHVVAFKDDSVVQQHLCKCV